MSKWFARLSTLFLFIWAAFGGVLAFIACLCKAFHCGASPNEQSALLIAFAITAGAMFAWMLFATLADR